MPTGISSLTAIGNGLSANDGTGDTLRSGADTINGNNTAIVTAINNLAASQSAGMISYLLKSDMDADLAHADGVLATVTNDPTDANNAVYRKSGASGSGSWVVTIDRVAIIKNDLASTATNKGASLVGFLQAGTGAVARTMQDKGRDTVSVKDFGAVGDGVTDCTDAVLAAIAAVRGDGVSILQWIGGDSVTAYASGEVQFGRGVYVVSADAIDLVADHGLTLRGKGSRGFNNSIIAATTLLISGTSDGFGIKRTGNGARNLTIEDMDICYADGNFTGDVIDSLSCQKLLLNRVYVGTFGTSSATRYQSARSLIRATYDEMQQFNQCVFSGAEDGFWGDDIRDILGNTFGGSLTAFNECVFYDFTGTPIRHDGNRTRQGLTVRGGAINPITVSPVRGIDVNNIDGLTLDSMLMGGSTTYAATTEWLRTENCTGSLRGMVLNDNSKAGTLGGFLDIRGNRIFCTDGFTLTSGVITSGANEFGKSTIAYTIAPTAALTFDLGPEYFKAAVGTSYSIASDSAFLSGRIRYSEEYDSSTNKFVNVSSRVTIANDDRKSTTVTLAAYTISRLDTGRMFAATGSTEAQTITLPPAAAGLAFSFFKPASQDLTIVPDTGDRLYDGDGVAKASVKALAADYGPSITLESYGAAGWRVVSRVGNWTFVA